MLVLSSSRLCSCTVQQLARVNSCRVKRHRFRRVCATPDSSNEFEGVGGNKDLQDALVEQLRVQVESQTLKEEIKEDLEQRVEGLKQIGEELISQLDAELGIEKFRTELESSQVLADANDQLNELEEQLQQIKDQIKADQADLRAFEAASASARSEGLFFRNLYQASADEDDDSEGDSSSDLPLPPGSRKQKRVLLDPAGARQAAAVVTSSAKEEVSSPFRMYLFGYMAAVLALVVVQDMMTPDPRYALDGLYGVLGMLLGVTTYNERQALMEVLDKQQQQVNATAQQRTRNSSTALQSSEAERSSDSGDGV